MTQLLRGTHLFGGCPRSLPASRFEIGPSALCAPATRCGRRQRRRRPIRQIRPFRRVDSDEKGVNIPEAEGRSPRNKRCALSTVTNKSPLVQPLYMLYPFGCILFGLKHRSVQRGVRASRFLISSFHSRQDKNAIEFILNSRGYLCGVVLVHHGQDPLHAAVFVFG